MRSFFIGYGFGLGFGLLSLWYLGFIRIVGSVSVWFGFDLGFGSPFEIKFKQINHKKIERINLAPFTPPPTGA